MLHDTHSFGLALGNQKSYPGSHFSLHALHVRRNEIAVYVTIRWKKTVLYIQERDTNTQYCPVTWLLTLIRFNKLLFDIPQSTPSQPPGNS